jgi:murein DD-endopeptidase MepM/ murein hydrolase activator NlpD
MDRRSRRPLRRAPERRRTLVVLATIALGALTVPAWEPAAVADELEEEREQVERELERAEEHLEESTSRAHRAGMRLLRARAELRLARGGLARARGELVVAEALDRQLQAQLESAVHRLRKARRELRMGKADVRAQEERLRGMVASSYEQADPAMLGLSMVFTTQDPAQLAGSLNANDDVVNLQATTLDRLEAARVVLTVQEEETEAAKREVAQRRRAAADNLRHKQALQAQAEAAARQVRVLVAARRDARAEALGAKTADERALEALQSERDRIEALIRERTPQTDRRGPVDGGGYLDQPVDGYVTSPFGWRTHPIWGYRSLHDGVDYGAPCGTPIRATAGGRVLSTYYSSSWGNRVILDHGVHRGVGLSTISNHLSSWAVSSGQSVARGQVIGYVGTTGWSTGCHLHFTVVQNGVAVDPMSWF